MPVTARGRGRAPLMLGFPPTVRGPGGTAASSRVDPLADLEVAVVPGESAASAPAGSAACVAAGAVVWLGIAGPESAWARSPSLAKPPAKASTSRTQSITPGTRAAVKAPP